MTKARATNNKVAEIIINIPISGWAKMRTKSKSIKPMEMTDS